MADTNFESLFARLRRFPDVEAANLQAWDATDKLLLDTAFEAHAAGLLQPRGLGVVGDRYGALTLGALTRGASAVRVHQDLVTGERALRLNAEALAIDAGFEDSPWALPSCRAPAWYCCSCPGPSRSWRKSPTPWSGTPRPTSCCWPAGGSNI